MKKNFFILEILENVFFFFCIKENKVFFGKKKGKRNYFLPWKSLFKQTSG